MRGENHPLTIHATGLPSLLPFNRQRILTSKVKMRVPFIQYQRFNIKEGVFLYWKKSAFF